MDSRYPRNIHPFSCRIVSDDASLFHPLVRNRYILVALLQPTNSFCSHNVGWNSDSVFRRGAANIKPFRWIVSAFCFLNVFRQGGKPILLIFLVNGFIAIYHIFYIKGLYYMLLAGLRQLF